MTTDRTRILLLYIFAGIIDTEEDDEGEGYRETAEGIPIQEPILLSVWKFIILRYYFLIIK